MENYYLRNVENIECVSSGDPGNRTFYFIAENKYSKVKIWLEKEQLIALALLLKNLHNSNKNHVEDDSYEEYPGNFDLDVKAIDFSLDLNRDSDRYELYIECVKTDEEELETLSVNIFLDQQKAKGLGDQAIKICAAGRKKCPLCSLPKDLDGSCDGNPCVKRNGHVPLI